MLSVPPEPSAEDIGMVDNGQIVRIGSLLDDVEASLKPAKDVYEFKEDPPIDNQAVEAIGWESGKSKVGVLTLRGRLILAVRTVENVTEPFVNEVIAEHERNFGRPNAQHFGTASHYRFWAKGNARLMICDTLDAKERLSVTVAIGQYELMDVLGMSSRQAEPDSKEADALLEKLRKKRSPK